MGALRLKTIGIHPLTDALQLHAILDALHSYGLDKHVTVEPKEGYHELTIPENIQERVGYALAAYVFKLILKEALLLGDEEDSTRPDINTIVKALRRSENLAQGVHQDARELKEFSELIIKHLSKRHPVTLELKNLSGKLEQQDTLSALENVLSREVKHTLKSARRLIAVLPIIGKYCYKDAEILVKSKPQEFDPVCGRLVRAGLKLALRYPVRSSKQNYGIGITLVTPASRVRAHDVWKAQAMLRVFRHRWIRRTDWGRAHTTLMLIDAFRLLKAFSEEAAGYIVEVLLVQSQGGWKSSASADELAIFHITGSEDMKYLRLGTRTCRPRVYRLGVNVAGESVIQVYPALRLARRLELLGGSVDWFVDGFVRRYYRERRDNEWVLNYVFTSNIVRAVTEYDVESLYLALREASVRAGEEGEVLVSDPYQLERLVAAIESLASEGGRSYGA